MDDHATVWNNLARVANVAAIIIVPIIGWVGWMIRDVWRELRMLNGRVGKIEQWQSDHEYNDRSQFLAVQRELDRLYEQQERKVNP